MICSARHDTTCVVCACGKAWSSRQSSLDTLADILAQTCRTRWVGGYSVDSDMPIGTVLSYPAPSNKGIALFHYTWPFIWFLSSLLHRDLLPDFSRQFCSIVIEEVSGHVVSLLPIMTAFRRLSPELVLAFNVVDESDIARVEKSGFLALPGGADGWIDDTFWTPARRVARDYDVLLCSTGLHNNLADVKRVDWLMSRYARAGRKERVAVVHFDGPGESVRWAADLRPGCVTWITSPVTSAEMRGLYQRSRAFGLMSDREGGSRYLAEAVSCGCVPIVSSRRQSHHAYQALRDAGGISTAPEGFWDEVSTLKTLRKQSLILPTALGLFSARVSLSRFVHLLANAGENLAIPRRDIYLQPEIPRHLHRPFPEPFGSAIPVIPGSYSQNPSTLPSVDFLGVAEALRQQLKG